MNDRDRKDLFTVEDPFEDEQAPAPAIAADAPGARQAAEAPFCEPGLDAVIASAFDRMGPSAAAEERMLAALIATCGDGAAAADLARRGPVERTGAVRGARRLRAGKVLLPAAACAGAAGRSGRARLSRPRRRTAERQPAGSSGQRDRLVVRELASISDSAASEDLGSASDGAANGAPEASRDDGSAGAPPSGGSARGALLRRFGQRELFRRQHRRRRAPPARHARLRPASYTSQPTRRRQPLAANPALVGAAIEQAHRLRPAPERPAVDRARFSPRRATRPSLRRALSGRRRLLLGRRSRVARASAPGAARSHRAESPRQTGIPDRVKGSKRERERP